MEQLSFLGGQQLPVEEHFTPDAHIVLHNGDVNDFVATLPDNSISLIVTSPPYNLGKDYENRVSIEQYLETQAKQLNNLCACCAWMGASVGR